MADSSKLTDWLTENASLLDLQVTEFSWAREWNVPLSDLEVSIEIEGRRFRGRGTACGEDLAFVKAGAEAIERAFCAGRGIHSVGVAAHTEERAARSGAIKELLERDAFFLHFFTRTPFSSRESHAGLRERFSGIFSVASAASISIRFFRARSASHVILAVAEGDQASLAFGGGVGLGCEPTEAAAAESALLECGRNIAAILLGDRRAPLSLEEFKSIPEPGSEDRQRLALDLSYWRGVSYLFPESSREAAAVVPAEESPILEKLAAPYRALHSCPLVVYRAHFSNPVRSSERSPTTIGRLQEFAGYPITEAQLQTLPHFLG